jgi:uncharacterized membrane protein
LVTNKRRRKPPHKTLEGQTMFNNILLMIIGLVMMLASVMDAITGFQSGLFFPLGFAVLGLVIFFAPLIESTLEG